MEATLSNGRFERRTPPRVSSTPRLVVASRGCTFWDRWVLRRLRTHGTRRRDPAREEGDGCETSGRGRTRAYTARGFASSNTVVVVRPARFALSSSTARIVVCRSEAKGGVYHFLGPSASFLPFLPSCLGGLRFLRPRFQFRSLAKTPRWRFSSGCEGLPTTPVPLHACFAFFPFFSTRFRPSCSARRSSFPSSCFPRRPTSLYRPFFSVRSGTSARVSGGTCPPF